MRTLSYVQPSMSASAVYRAWAKQGKARQGLMNGANAQIIRSIHKQYKSAYGSPRMIHELRERGFPASQSRVERLMSEPGL